MLVTTQAHQKFIRQTPRKLRLVADSLRALTVTQALLRLEYADKRAARVLKKVLVQAQKNAINNVHLSPDSLLIKKITIDEGPTYKRWQPVSRGRAHPIMKRTSHCLIVVSGEDQATKPALKPTKNNLNKEKKSTK
jgi:large subunit ribosomal protein L22